MTDVTVVMPAWRAAGTIGAAVRSVLSQEGASLELVVVDDCGGDGTIDAALEAASGDPRLRVLRRAANGGPAAARNTGMDAAAGDWIALLDSDDVFLPDRLAALLALGRRTGADIVSDNMLMQEPGRPAYELLPAGLPEAGMRLGVAEYVRGNLGEEPGRRSSFGFMQPMFGRGFLRRHGLRHDERNRFGEDYMLHLACLSAGAGWWVTPRALYLCHIQGGSLTEVQRAEDWWRIAEFERGVLRRLAGSADAAARAALRRHVAKAERLYAYRAFTDAVKAGRPGAAARVLAEAPVRPVHITQELVRQAPIIVRKALRGGYRS